jgi:hypothetical protein
LFAIKNPDKKLTFTRYLPDIYQKTNMAIIKSEDTGVLLDKKPDKSSFIKHKADKRLFFKQAMDKGR